MLNAHEYIDKDTKMFKSVGKSICNFFPGSVDLYHFIRWQNAQGLYCTTEKQKRNECKRPTNRWRVCSRFIINM